MLIIVAICVHLLFDVGEKCRKGWMLIIVAYAPDAPAEEIRSRVPPVPTPPYLFKQKERFCQCH